MQIKAKRHNRSPESEVTCKFKKRFCLVFAWFTYRDVNVLLHYLIQECAAKLSKTQRISSKIWLSPADTRRWINVGLTLVHRLRRWTNGKPTLNQRLVSAGIRLTSFRHIIIHLEHCQKKYLHISHAFNSLVAIIDYHVDASCILPCKAKIQK